MNREKYNNYRRNWRRENPEKVKAQTKRSYLNRKADGSLKQTRDKYRQTHREKINTYALNYYKKNRDRILEKRRHRYQLKQQRRQRLLQQKREQQKRWLARQTPDEKYAWGKRAALRRYYGITWDQYILMLKHQHNRCAICKKSPKTGKVLCVDHDHNTGIVRGLLCDLCNTFLGRIQDSIPKIQAILKYLNLKENTTMPVKKVTQNGKTGYRWGSQGAFYPYTPGNAASRERAKKKAIQQGLAVAYRTGKKPEL
jgi:hypothetical protein